MNRLDMLALNDNGFAFDPMNGESYTLSESAVEILSMLRQGRSPKEIAESLAEQFEVSAEDAHADTIDFLERLKHFGLVEP